VRLTIASDCGTTACSAAEEDEKVCTLYSAEEEAQHGHIPASDSGTTPYSLHGSRRETV